MLCYINIGKDQNVQVKGDNSFLFFQKFGLSGGLLIVFYLWNYRFFLVILIVVLEFYIDLLLQQSNFDGSCGLLIGLGSFGFGFGNLLSVFLRHGSWEVFSEIVSDWINGRVLRVY